MGVIAREIDREARHSGASFDQVRKQYEDDMQTMEIKEKMADWLAGPGFDYLIGYLLEDEKSWATVEDVLLDTQPDHSRHGGYMQTLGVRLSAAVDDAICACVEDCYDELLKRVSDEV